MKKILTLFVFFLCIYPSLAHKLSQGATSDDYFIPDYLKYDNITYKKNIKTVQLFPEGKELSFPIIQLGKDEKLLLSFDDLEGEQKTYNYTLVHCDALWNPTSFLYTEYIEGFHDELITEYKFSFNTIQNYTHYTLVFPSNGLKITKSGNYVVKVFQDYDEQNVVLTRRFMVLNKQVTIEGRVKEASIIKDRYTKQEIDFTILNPNFEINDPYQSLKVALIQNQQFDNSITGLKPTFAKSDQLIYEYDEGNSFLAGDEFRFFADRNFRSANEKVAKYIFDENKQNNIYLLPEDKRTFKRYSSQSDINGNYIIKTLDGQNSPTEADYAFIHFFLPSESPLINQDVYVFGALSDWKFLPEFKMSYDSTAAAYKASPYLKQGYYNYEFLATPVNPELADVPVFESNHNETENDYYILVYYKVFGTYYDQLIGYQQLNSRIR